MSRVVFAPVNAAPTAVETTPSIPFAPRLASTRRSRRPTPNHSTSRTGIDDDATRIPPGGRVRVRWRATPGSDSGSAARVSSMAAAAAVAAACHACNHSATGSWSSATAGTASIITAVRWAGSGHHPAGAITISSGRTRSSH